MSGKDDKHSALLVFLPNSLMSMTSRDFAFFMSQDIQMLYYPFRLDKLEGWWCINGDLCVCRNGCWGGRTADNLYRDMVITVLFLGLYWCIGTVTCSTCVTYTPEITTHTHAFYILTNIEI